MGMTVAERGVAGGKGIEGGLKDYVLSWLARSLAWDRTMDSRSFMGRP